MPRTLALAVDLDHLVWCHGGEGGCGGGLPWFLACKINPSATCGALGNHDVEWLEIQEKREKFNQKSGQRQRPLTIGISNNGPKLGVYSLNRMNRMNSLFLFLSKSPSRIENSGLDLIHLDHVSHSGCS